MSEEISGYAGMDQEVRGYFLRQLRFLRGGAGLTPGRVGNHTMSFLRGSFGVTTASEGYELLRAALNSLDSSHLHVQALLNAYGGEGLPDDLKQRRRNFAEEHGLTENRVFHLEDLALIEMVENLDALARGEEIKPRKPKAAVSSIEESSADEPTVKELLISLIEATREQTAVQRETNELLKRLAAVWTT